MKKLSQHELAVELGISQSKLCTIESNQDKAIDFTLMDKVCKYFQVGFDYFLNEKQINKVEKNEGGVVGSNFGTINNLPENILTQVQSLINDLRLKELKIKELEETINKISDKY